ncbi:MAG: C40 family peptidase [Leeuwenhoekiella sp.]
MKYGICPLGNVPLRLDPSDASEMVNQVLYGETFKVLEQRKKWSRIRLDHDNYEGWLDNKQYLEISEEAHQSSVSTENQLAKDLLQLVTLEDGQVMPIPLGSVVSSAVSLEHIYEGVFFSGKRDKENLVETALLYIKSPYLWGGRTPFGLDCSGFTQMVYKLNGHKLFRDASQQAAQGEPLSFIEESEPGDLAFFDNNEGAIIHVGIMMADHYIIHCHGEVRIDRIDHTGIYNATKREHSHQLRVIKRVV